MKGLILNNFIAINYKDRDKDNYLHFITHVDPECVTVEEIVSPTAQLVYTSKFNAWYMEKYLKVKPGLIKGLEMERMHRIEYQNKKVILVGFTDSNYSIGSVMIVLKGAFGTFLVTGNMCYTPDMLRAPLLQPLVGKTPLSKLYLDYTQYKQPSNSKSIYEVTEMIISLIRDSPEKNIFLYVEHLGQEKIITVIASTLKEKIVIDERRMDMMKFLQQDQYFTLDHSLGRIYVISKPIVKRFPSDQKSHVVIKLEKYTSLSKNFKHYELNNNVHYFKFWCHSTYAQRCNLISKLKPELVINFNFDQGMIHKNNEPISSTNADNAKSTSEVNKCLRDRNVMDSGNLKSDLSLTNSSDITNEAVIHIAGSGANCVVKSSTVKINDNFQVFDNQANITLSDDLKAPPSLLCVKNCKELEMSISSSAFNDNKCVDEDVLEKLMKIKLAYCPEEILIKCKGIIYRVEKELHPYFVKSSSENNLEETTTEKVHGANKETLDSKPLNLKILDVNQINSSLITSVGSTEESRIISNDARTEELSAISSVKHKLIQINNQDDYVNNHVNTTSLNASQSNTNIALSNLNASQADIGNPTISEPKMCDMSSCFYPKKGALSMINKLNQNRLGNVIPFKKSKNDLHSDNNKIQNNLKRHLTVVDKGPEISQDNCYTAARVRRYISNRRLAANSSSDLAISGSKTITIRHVGERNESNIVRDMNKDAGLCNTSRTESENILGKSGLTWPNSKPFDTQIKEESVENQDKVTIDVLNCDSQVITENSTSCDIQVITENSTSCDSQVITENRTSWDSQVITENSTSCDSQVITENSTSCNSQGITENISINLQETMENIESIDQGIISFQLIKDVLGVTDITSVHLQEDSEDELTSQPISKSKRRRKLSISQSEFIKKREGTINYCSNYKRIPRSKKIPSYISESYILDPNLMDTALDENSSSDPIDFLKQNNYSSTEIKLKEGRVLVDGDLKKIGYFYSKDRNCYLPIHQSRRKAESVITTYMKT